MTDTNDLQEDSSNQNQDEQTGESSDNQSDSSEQQQYNELPDYAKKRLKRQDAQHYRDMQARDKLINELKEEMNQVKSMIHDAASQNSSDDDADDSQSSFSGLSEDQISEMILNGMEKAEKTKKEKATQAEQERYYNEHLTNFAKKLEDASTKYDDFDIAVNQNENFTPAIVNATMSMPNGTEVLYKLGKNSKELRRISSLPPHEQQNEVIKLGYTLHAVGSLDGNDEEPNPSNPLPEMRGQPAKVKKNAKDMSVDDMRAQLKQIFRR